MKMSRKSWFIAAISAALVAGLVTSIVLVVQKGRPVTIQDALDRCGEDGNDVRIAGRVMQVFDVPYVDMSVYRFVDDVESIWVISRHPAPAEDREMIVRGSMAMSSRFSDRCSEFINDEGVCQAAARIIQMVAGNCVLFEDRRE